MTTYLVLDKGKPIVVFEELEEQEDFCRETGFTIERITFVERERSVDDTE